MTFPALLSHSAGFNLHGFPGYRASAPLLSLEDVLEGRGITPRLRRIKPYGKQYCYSGGGITLAELAFTRITGTTLREAFEKEIAEPLGLTRTGYFQPLDEDKTANAAYGGRLGEKEDPAHGYHYYPEHAAAGLWTTPTELTRIGIALSRSFREGGLLSKKTAERMMTPYLSKYGLCVYRINKDTFGEELASKFGDDTAYHDGENEGFLTEWIVSLTQDVCVASMTNRSDAAACDRQFDLACELFRKAKE